MPLYMTSSALIADIKRRAMIPNNQKTFQTADLLSLINTELQIGLIPTILSVHEEYFVYQSTIPLVAYQSNYQIPERAIGGKLRDLFYTDTQGTLHEMTRISPDDKAYYQTSHLQNRFIAYYIQGDEILISPQVGAGPTGSLRPTYYLRPNEIVEETRAAYITGIAVGATTTVFSITTPSVMTAAYNADNTTKFDLIQTKGSHKTKKIDLVPVSLTSSSIEFNNSDLLDYNLQNISSAGNAAVVGDYIALAGECIIPQIPDELHAVLAQRVAARCMAALGDQAGVQAANEKLAEMEVKTGTLIDNRVEGSPQKVTNFGGLLRTSRIRRRGWF